MNHFEIWCNLVDSHKDLEFVEAVHGYLGYLKQRGLLHDYHVRRRKYGFGPSELGEFQISIEIERLGQLEDAFDLVATRSGEIERLHVRMYSMVKDVRSALYRDFPDPVRIRAGSPRHRDATTGP